MMGLIFSMIFLIFFFMFDNLIIFFSSVCFMMFFFFLFLFSLETYWTFLSIHFGIDVYSYLLIILVFWMFGMMFLCVGEMNYFQMSMFLMLMFFLVLSFMSLNLFIFYLFFEMSLIPIFFIILRGGYNFERLKAGLYMFIYTLVVSLPLLLIMFKLYINNYSLMYFYYLYFNMNLSFILYMLVISSFLVKLPMYLVHIWLPKAHLEAPVYGSMILASVMLKLGSYGLLRLMMMMELSALMYNFIFIVISIMGMFFVSLICLCQLDMKKLIAYSSVVHMGLLVSGMMSMSLLGILGSYMMMIAHGLCSSGLFYLVNLSFYRTMSRNLMLNKGMINFFSTLSMFWFMFCACNLSSPLSLNLVGEIMLLGSLISWDWGLMMVLMLSCFFSSCYSIYLFSVSQHGGLNIKYLGLNSVKLVDYMILILHWLPMNFLIFNLNFLM